MLCRSHRHIRLHSHSHRNLSLFASLQQRGCISAHTLPEAECIALLDQAKVPVYAGFDPTADSLHLGNLSVLMVLRRMQRAGCRPICVVGGATGMIGDPSGRNSERQLLDAETVSHNLRGIERDLRRVLDFEGPCAAMVVNNHSWYSSMGCLDFLRDVGKHFRVSQMLAKESVSARLGPGEEGMSFTEFSYQLLQGYDFLHLHRTLGVCVQVGGSDQWGNITAGTQLIRKTTPNSTVLGITLPLLTTAHGEKFGKSAGNALWMDPAKTSPYALYQYLLNVSDADVGNLLLGLTECSVEELAVLKGQELGTRAMQTELAKRLVGMLHGQDNADQCVKASEYLFSEEPSAEGLQELGGILKDAGVERCLVNVEECVGTPLPVLCGLVTSRRECKRLLQSGGLYVNGRRIGDLEELELKKGSVLVLRSGKKRIMIVELV